MDSYQTVDYCIRPCDNFWEKCGCLGLATQSYAQNGAYALLWPRCFREIAVIGGQAIYGWVPHLIMHPSYSIARHAFELLARTHARTRAHTHTPSASWPPDSCSDWWGFFVLFNNALENTLTEEKDVSNPRCTPFKELQHFRDTLYIPQIPKYLSIYISTYCIVPWHSFLCT